MKKLMTAMILVVLFGLLPAFAGELAPTVPGNEGQSGKNDFGNYLPEGVPNIFDPEVRDQFQPVGQANLQGNPDFPVLILQNTAGGQPQTIFLGLDARNGKESWSLASDPVILIVLFADQETIIGTWVDEGFADSGKPSRVFRKLDGFSPGSIKGLRKGISLTYL